MDIMIAQELYYRLYDSPKTVHNTPTEESCHKDPIHEVQLRTVHIHISKK